MFVRTYILFKHQTNCFVTASVDCYNLFCSDLFCTDNKPHKVAYDGSCYCGMSDTYIVKHYRYQNLDRAIVSMFLVGLLMLMRTMTDLSTTKTFPCVQRFNYFNCCMFSFTAFYLGFTHQDVFDLKKKNRKYYIQSAE